MVPRSAWFALALIGLVPFAAVAGSQPSAQGPYTYYQLDPRAQKTQTDAFHQRLTQDWLYRHEPPHKWANPPDTEAGIEAAMRDYWKRHPKDRPELWRFDSKDGTR
jgi:hypothetical protein